MENQLKTYSFEYNEQQGNFHQNFGDAPENTNGYRTICNTTTSFWRPFSKMLHRRYNFNSANRPSFDKILKEWNDYVLLLEDLNTIRAVDLV